MEAENFDLVVIGAGKKVTSGNPLADNAHSHATGWAGLIAASTFLRLAPTTRLLIVDDRYVWY